MNEVDSDVKRAGSDWPLLKLGFFSSSLDKLQSIKTEFDNGVKERGLY